MNQRKAGVALSYISMGLSSIIALVYVPMLLYYLTKDQYGIYQLMGSLIAYLSIMDFGLANATTRYLSQAYATQNTQRAQKIIDTSHTLYLFISVILVALGSIFYLFITPLYGNTLSAQDLLIAKHIFLIMLLNIAVAIPSHIFIAVINAQEQFVFLRGMNVVKVLLQPLLVWGILAWKASVLNLVLTQTVFNLCMILVNYIYCKRKLRLCFAFNIRDTILMKELTGFSVFVFLHAVMNQVYWRLGQVILGAVSGAAAVATYSVAMQFINFSTSLPATLGGVFLPKLSALSTHINSLTEINAYFCKVSRLQFMFIMLLFMGFSFLGKTFIALWVGPSYELCYYIALIIMAAYIIDVSQNIGIPLLQALKKHAFRAYVYLAMAGLNIALSIPLAKRYGEIGCATATAICLTLGSGFAINWYYHHIGLDLKLFFKNLFQLSKPLILACMLIGVENYFFPLRTDWISLVIHGVGLTATYGACMWLFGFNQYEKNLFIQPLTYVLRILKR